MSVIVLNLFDRNILDLSSLKTSLFFPHIFLNSICLYVYLSVKNICLYSKLVLKIYHVPKKKKVYHVLVLFLSLI